MPQNLERIWSSSLLVGWLFLALVIPFSISNGYGEQTACRGREVQLQPIPPQYGEPEPGSSGSVCFAEESTDSWPITVKLKGLTPKESYWLSINAGSSDSPESRILGEIRVRGWPPGRYYAEEGYWDFKQITTDGQGNSSKRETITLPLPSGQYSVKFFVKENYDKGGKVVLRNDSLVFEVKQSWWEWFFSWEWIVVLMFVGIGVWVWWRFFKTHPNKRVRKPIDERSVPPPPPIAVKQHDAILGEVNKALYIYDENPSPSELGKSLGIICAPQGGMEEVTQAILGCAQGDSDVLILGETGTGKEVVAKVIHSNSPRAQCPFVAQSCHELPKGLAESILFGIEGGRATGVEKQIGKFREANKGTLFLDEIGDLLPELQGKLFRALQEREVTPVGGSPVKIDVRLITATDVDLRDSNVRKEKGFRDPLYFRIKVSTVRLLPLRNRREDILYLVDYFKEKFSSKPSSRLYFDEKAKIALVCYDWPGNIRELEHFVEGLYASRQVKMSLEGLEPAMKDAYDRYEKAGGQGGLIAAIKEIAGQFLTEFRGPEPGQAQQKLKEAHDKLKQVFIQRGLLKKEKCDALEGRKAGIYSLFGEWLEDEKKARVKLIKIVADLRGSGAEVTSLKYQKYIDDFWGMTYKNIREGVKDELARRESLPNPEHIQQITCHCSPPVIWLCDQLSSILSPCLLP